MTIILSLVCVRAGNDLARALKWNGGYTGEKAEQILLNVKDADVVHLDRCIAAGYIWKEMSTVQSECQLFRGMLYSE